MIFVQKFKEPEAEVKRQLKRWWLLVVINATGYTVLQNIETVGRPVTVGNSFSFAETRSVLLNGQSSSGSKSHRVFLPRCAMHKCDLCCRAVAECLSVCHFVYCVKMATAVRVAMECEQEIVPKFSNGVIFNDLEWLTVLVYTVHQRHLRRCAINWCFTYLLTYLTKFLTTRSTARPLCDSLTSCTFSRR